VCLLFYDEPNPEISEPFSEKSQDFLFLFYYMNFKNQSQLRRNKCAFYERPKGARWQQKTRCKG